MKEEKAIAEKIQEMLRENPSYSPEAYSFVLSSLSDTMKRLPSPRHISGQEFLEGVRIYALNQFGPMTNLVFEHWGLRGTLDFGRIVFALVNAKLMRKRDEDSLDDFKDVYDFKEVFDGKFNFDS